MRVQQAHSSGRPLAAPLCLATMAFLTALVLVGCGQSSPSNAASTVKECGTARTAANTPVEVEIERGQVPCSTALSVERAYAKAILEGKAPGNGGGGPVPVSGWTCQGFPTPQLLKTGQTSKCVKGTNLIMAVLASPS